MLNVPQKDTYIYVSSYIKIYPKFARYYVFDEPILVLQKGYEPVKKILTSKSTQEQKEEILNQSIQRTKTKIADLVLCNEFELFVTFTFKKNRQDIIKCKNSMSKWIENTQKRYGKFKYIIVPEYHKDKKSIHFHALLKDFKAPLIKAKNPKTNKPLIRKKRQVYNITAYQLGFTDCEYIEDYQKVSSYIRKYITKEMITTTGKKRYWTSQKLQRPKIIPDPIIDPYTMQEMTKNWSKNKLTIYTLNSSINIVNKL